MSRMGFTVKQTGFKPCFRFRIIGHRIPLLKQKCEFGTATPGPCRCAATTCCEIRLSRSSLTAINLSVAVIALGLTPFFKKTAIAGGIEPLIAALGSGLIAALISVALLRGAASGQLACLFRGSSVKHLLVVGVIASGIVTLLAAFALVETTATNRSLFQSLYPAATVVFAWLMLGERLRGKQYASIGMMLVGLFLVNGTGGGVRFGTAFWLLAATLPLVGFSDAYAKRFSGEVSPLLFSAGRNVYGLVFLLLCLPAVPQPALEPDAGWLWLVAAGLSTSIGVFAFYKAMDRIEASLVAAFVSLAPLTTAGAEIYFRGLRLAFTQWLGVALVIIGAIALALMIRNRTAD